MSPPALTIASLLRDPQLRSACGQWLREERFELVQIGDDPDPAAELASRWDGFDAVLLEQGVISPESLQRLRKQGLILPAVVVGPLTGQLDYHPAEVHLPPDQLEQLSYSFAAALSRFLRRDRQEAGGGSDGSMARESPEGKAEEQWHLSSRLRERLGYLGVFYKRDASRFLRNLPSAERQKLLRSLERTYRDLLISYFRDPAAANQALESFVNTAFFSDLPITKAVEIHVNLIDGFGKKLKLEGHQNDFLQDYRLALLDVMAHLCEMYRRSVPPDLPDSLVIPEASPTRLHQEPNP
jgi:circadian clock protein KaiA